MEAIKCPNCGSEKVQELTEEKYVCLACDNVFLVHNLSKEFQKTDEHISVMHQDLKDTLKNLNAVGEKNELNNMVKNANALFEQGRIEDAQSRFMEICEHYAWSYQGYYGMFCCVLKKSDCKMQVLLEYYNRMKTCEDYTQEVDAEVQETMNKVFSKIKKGWVWILEKSRKQCETKIAELTQKLETEVNNSEVINRKVLEKKEEFEKKWGKAKSQSKIVSIVLAVFVLGVLIFIVRGLFGWVVDTKYLFQQAIQENFINMIWQFLIYGIWGIVKIAISIVVIIGTGFIGMMVTMLPMMDSGKDKAESEIMSAENALRKNQEATDRRMEELRIYKNIRGKIEKMLVTIETIDLNEKTVLKKIDDIEAMVTKVKKEII